MQPLKPQEPRLPRLGETSMEQEAQEKTRKYRSWPPSYSLLPPREHALALQPCAAASISVCSLAQQRFESEASHP